MAFKPWYTVMIQEKVIAETTAWINSVVIGCHFCPFAAKAMLGKSVRFVVVEEASEKTAMQSLLEELHYLDETADMETAFIIFPNHFTDFHAYLKLVASAEKLVSRHGYDGIYQVASFHPDYCFAGTDADDPANYTNRSIYPMLHILRESSITNALKYYVHPEEIPQRNIEFAREKGLLYMQLLRAACIVK